MRLDLLKALADHLDTVDDETFSFGVWRDPDRDSACEREECGYRRLVRAPMFQELKVKVHRQGMMQQMHESNKEYSAMAGLFEITLADAYSLFSPNLYVLRLVADRIRTFIKEHEEEQILVAARIRKLLKENEGRR